MNVGGARDTLTGRDTREAYITYNIFLLLFLLLLLCVHENRDHDDDHFENEAVRLSLSADRFGHRLVKSDSSLCVYTRAYYIQVYIYWYLCLPVSAEAAFQI